MITTFVNRRAEPRTVEVPLFRQRPQRTAVSAAAQNVATPARAIKAAPIVRQVSTLYPDSRFELVEKDRNNGFLPLFNGRYESPKAIFLFMSMVTAAAYPTLQQLPIGKKVRGNAAPIKELSKGDRESINKVLIDSFKKQGAAALCNVKKQAADFRVTIPLFMSKGFNLPNITARLTSREGVTDENELTPLVHGKSWPLATLAAKGGNYTDKFRTSLESADPVLKYLKLGESDAWVLELTINKGQAEFLTNTSWVEIRPMDLYGLLFEWVLTYYGDLIKATPDYAIPLRQIAKSLDPTRTVPRLSEDGLLVTERAEILSLPRELDAVRTFEDRYASAYTHPNGSFGAIDIDDPVASHRKPPKAMPVLIDWSNLKFAYTTQDGRLQTRSLDRCRPVTITHIVRFLERRISEDSIRGFFSQTINVGVKWGFAEYINDIRSISEFERAIAIVGKQVDEYIKPEDISLYEVARYATTNYDSLVHPSFGKTITTFFTLCMAILQRIDSEPETAYAEYSVPTIIELRASLLLFTKYGTKIRELRAQDEELRKPYLTQPPETVRPEELAKYTDANMPLEAVPFANNAGKQPWGALPHQAKVAHLTASAPPNVILPVDTGGGKSSIIIYDILREMGRGQKGPFLILCPSHLVSNYVREFVYFTNAEVNVIPVTNYTINRHGYERLQTMIERAPVNTVLIADFNSIRNKASSIAYGVAPTKVFPAIEFLRQFAPQYVAIDESHYLRNRNARQEAVARLVSDIPKIRLASGTLVANVLLDLVAQFALMDPTLFGTEEDFIKKYAAGSTSNKIVYKDGAEQEVNRALRSSCLFAKAQKKEWAAILPFPLEQIHGVKLSDKQLEVYQKIFEQSFIEALKADPARFSLLYTKQEDMTDKQREELLALNLDGLMSQCLQRIEAYLIAPGEDEGGMLELSGDDLVSPKVRKLVDICKHHLESDIPGKILIFTNYEKATEAIDKALKAAGLGDISIYYKATEKEKCGAEFENNPNKKIMFGIENSMNTGLNLQFCSRLVRLGCVWTPGVLEQGNARIGRPNLKVKELRPYVYYDWIVALDTLDVTKISYLISKTISAAKFAEAGNERFDDIDVPPLFPMTLENIQNMNSWTETLPEYAEAYKKYQTALEEEYAEYREKAKDYLFDEDGNRRMAPVPRAPNIPGAALIRRVPYHPGTELYGQDQLGLVRYDQFLRQQGFNVADEEDEFADEGGSEPADTSEGGGKGRLSPEKREQLTKELALVNSMWAHTEFGDGQIENLSVSTIKVRLDSSGELVSVDRLNCFLITRAETSPKDIRTQVLKLRGQVPLDSPIEVLESQLTPAKMKMLERERRMAEQEAYEQQQQKQATTEFEFRFSIVNDWLSIILVNDDNETAVSVVQQSGFKYSPEYYYAEMRTPKMLFDQFQAWYDAGLEIPADYTDHLTEVYKRFKKSSKTGVANFFGVARELEIRNFYKVEFKPDPDANTIRPFPLIQDNVLYIALPAKGHPGSKNAMRHKVPGVTWYLEEEGSALAAYTKTRNNAVAFFDHIEELGYTISNKDELIAELRTLKTIPAKPAK